MNIKQVSKVTNNVAKPLEKHCQRAFLTAPITDTFTCTTKKAQTFTEKAVDMFNGYMKKINEARLAKGQDTFFEGKKITSALGQDVELFSKDLVEHIKKSDDIFTIQDMFKMQELHELKQYKPDEIIKYRGSDVKLSNLKKSVNFKKEAEITKPLEEYIENISRFVNKEAQDLEVSSRKINKFIELKGNPIEQKTIYRGIIDDEEITRLLSKLNSKQNSKTFYSPSRITSTSKEFAEALRASDKKCVLEIAVPNAGSSKAAKAIDVNKYYDAKKMKNDFAFQKELLLPSDCQFELINARKENGTIIIKAALS